MRLIPTLPFLLHFLQDTHFHRPYVTLAKETDPSLIPFGGQGQLQQAGISSVPCDCFLSASLAKHLVGAIKTLENPNFKRVTKPGVFRHNVTVKHTVFSVCRNACRHWVDFKQDMVVECRVTLSVCASSSTSYFSLMIYFHA